MDHETNGKFFASEQMSRVRPRLVSCAKRLVFQEKKYAKYCCKYQKMCKTIYVISMWSFTGE